MTQGTASFLDLIGTPLGAILIAVLPVVGTLITVRYTRKTDEGKLQNDSERLSDERFEKMIDNIDQLNSSNIAIQNENKALREDNNNLWSEFRKLRTEVGLLTSHLDYAKAFIRKQEDHMRDNHLTPLPRPVQVQEIFEG